MTGEQIERIYGESRSAGASEFIGAVEYDPERDRFEAYSTHSGRRGPLFAEDEAREWVLAEHRAHLANES